VTPIDYGDVCINYDKSAYGDSNPPPQSLADLTKPEYKSQLVVEDPGTSSPGLAFMLATIAEFPEGGAYTWLDYWRDLRANDVVIVSGWEEAYESTFSGGSGTGDRPLVVSYATSPVAEVYYASPQPTESPTGVMTDGCFRQVEFAGVLAGTQKPAHARELVDFMLSNEFQADIPLNMFVFPASPNTDLPKVFSDFAVNVPQPLTLPPDTIAAHRDEWLNAWSAAVH
jgi:thiamine transport system substrate-binding protein